MRRKPEKTEDKPAPGGGGGQTKRGPGRPPGSTKTNDSFKSNSLEPPEKKLKTKDPQPNDGLSLPALPAPQQPLLPGIRGNPLKWKVAEVCEFIKNLPGCGEYVEDFAQQEIDGQALMLLKADHLMSAMSIKLGPALKICRHIEQIREELNKN